MENEELELYNVPLEDASEEVSEVIDIDESEYNAIMPQAVYDWDYSTLITEVRSLHKDFNEYVDLVPTFYEKLCVFQTITILILGVMLLCSRH